MDAAPPPDGSLLDSASMPGAPPAGPAPAAAVAAMLAALAKVVASLRTYDPSHEVVRQLLAAYRDRSREALESGAAVELDVLPFELRRGGEVVYAERDREQSIAHVLHRDGVRRLVLEASASWDDLVALLEALACRSCGVELPEDDEVTLLARIDGHRVRVTALDRAGAQPAPGEPLPRASLPALWDLPLPAPGSPGPVAAQEIADEHLELLRSEAAPELLIPSAMDLVRTLMNEALEPSWPLPLDELAAFLEEARDFLLAEAQLAALAELVRAVAGSAVGQELSVRVLASFADAGGLARLLAAVPTDAKRLPFEVEEILELLPDDPGTAALELWAKEPDAGRRQLLFSLVAPRLDWLSGAALARIVRLPEEHARELLASLVTLHPEKALDAATRAVGHPARAVRAQALEVLAASGAEDVTARLLALLVEAEEDARLDVIAALGRRADPDAFAPLARLAQQGFATLSRRTADAIARALAALGPIPAVKLFAKWLAEAESRPGHDGLRTLQLAAIVGLGEVPGDAPETMIRNLARRADPDLERHCREVLTQRIRGGPGHG